MLQKLIINIMLQSSTYKKQTSYSLPQKQKIEADTSQTLTYLSPNISNIQMNIYKEVQNQNNNYQILEYTLSHCNLDWLQDRLGQVDRMGNQRFNCGDAVLNRKQSVDNLELLSEQVTVTLHKISQHRKIMQHKLREYLYLKSKETDRKNLKKSNIYKYKQLLVAIKKLHDQTTNNTSNQSEINQMKDRLKGSGVILVPSLIQKSLYNLAQKTIVQKKILLEISNVGNLRTIVEYFMSKSLLAGEYQIQSKHKLFIKFKQYVLLKSYVRFTQQGRENSHRQLDRICQENINVCIQEYMSKLSSLELTKIRSLVQCNQLINFYLSEISKKFVVEMMKTTVSFIQNLKRKNKKIEEQFISGIINKNKKVEYKNFCIPSNYFSILAQNYEQMKGTTGIEQIGQFLKFIEDRSMFLQLYARQFDINFTIQDIKVVALRECLRHILNPLIKLSMGIIKITNKNNKERHYHSTKLLARNIQTWKQLFSRQKLKKQQDLIHQIQCKIDELQIREQKNQKPIIQDEKNTKKMKNKKQKQNNMTPAQFYIQYHAAFGQVYLYLANKISNVGNAKNETKQTEQLINVWTQIICSQIMHHQLEQLQPANILADLNFMQGQMIEIIEQCHRKQNKLDNLYLKLQKQKKSTKQKHIKNINQQQKQNIYLQIMQLNLKVISYNKLMSVCKIIGIQNQIIKINEEIYEDTYRKLQF